MCMCVCVFPPTPDQPEAVQQARGEVGVVVGRCHDNIPLLLQDVKCVQDQLLLTGSDAWAGQEVEQGAV